ncbi:MAG: thiamine-phosphate kinase [Methanosphaera stadtmanae]|nr:thiamine-phosphate kinase [Methanosphaera stadtmanae]
MNKKLISEIGERNLIRILLDKRDSKLKSIHDKIKESYHDDAALVDNSSKYTVISTDMLIQHTHFPKNMTPYQMGEKVVTVNVSDILAMNANPDSILISMGLPPQMTLNEYEELTDGILDKCDEYDINLIGGDINQNTEIILCGTSIGKVNEEFRLQKDINSDNLIAVTGELGSPAAALDLIYGNNDIPEEEKKEILKTLYEPTLPINESKIFQQFPSLTTSITDITDGLAIELGHLNDKNKDIGFEIFFDKIPYNKNIEKVAKLNNKDLKDYLLHFGEEFELLITLNDNEYYKHQDKLNNIYVIGKTNSSGKITLIREDSVEIIPVKGYEHLKDD